MPEPDRLIAGAMSGTSGDGVDVALVSIAGSGMEMTARLLHHHHVPFNDAVRRMLFAIRDTQQLHLRDLATLGREISMTYARAVRESLIAADLRAQDLAAIAAHGQTLYHDPPNTIQWFDPSLLAAEVGCAVVSDFRRADCAAAGQGAPLVPFADYILFRDPHKDRVLLNLGGIANVTWLPAGAAPGDMVAFDTGPASCVSDYLCRTYDPEGPGFDIDGARASGGKDWNGLSRYLLETHPYFEQPPPKSTDGPAMIAAFEQAPTSLQPFFGHHPARSEHGLSDLLWTACAFSAKAVQHALYHHLPRLPKELIVSGGGVRNKTLMNLIAFELPVKILTTDDIGVRADAKEAIAFALLGAATLEGFPSNIPSVTGARRAVVLGSITPRP